MRRLGNRCRVGAVALVVSAGLSIVAAADDPFVGLPDLSTPLDAAGSSMAVPRSSPRVAISPSAAVSADAPPLARRRFLAGERFLERISSRLERGAAPERVDLWMLDPSPHSATTASLGRDVWRATRKSLERHLLDATTFDEQLESSWEERIRPRGAGTGETRTAASGRSSVGFRLGFSHLLPRIEMRCAAGDGALRLTLHARGRVGVDYRLGPRGRARLHAGFDPRHDLLRLGWQASF